jgi:hypothetical protein
MTPKSIHQGLTPLKQSDNKVKLDWKSLKLYIIHHTVPCAIYDVSFDRMGYLTF